MSNHRYIKFWPQDWHRDMGLQMCSLAARGLWMEMLCMAHEGDPPGHVTFNGEQATTREIAVLAKTSEREVKKLLQELERHRVFSRTEAGTIYSRRMVRDTARSELGAEQVKQRWGPGEQSGTSRTKRLSEARKKGTHTPEQWEAMLRVFDYKCLKCSREGDTVKDHIKPIYMGGSDAIENLQPLCSKCNGGKGRDTTDYRFIVNPRWRNAYENAYENAYQTPSQVPKNAYSIDHRSESEADAGARGAPRQGIFLDREGHDPGRPVGLEAVQSTVVNLATAMRAKPPKAPELGKYEQIAAVVNGPERPVPMPQEPQRTVEEQLAFLRGERA